MISKIINKKTNPDIKTEFVFFICVNDEQKRASFYGESGASVHGGDTTKRQIGNYIYLDI